MSFIYSRAQKVIAWLGANEYPSQQNLFYCMSIDWKAGEASRIAASLANGTKLQYTSSLSKKTISRLADSTYWTRLWIVQEACLAYDLVFVHGASVWGFDRIHRLKPLEDIPLHETDERMKYDAMLRLIDARLARHTDATKLENLIERFKNQACSDLRDRVYGLVGLANDVRPFSGADHRQSSIPRRIKYEPSDDTDEFYGTQRKDVHRGKGRIKIDRHRSFYDIWKDVVIHAFFHARLIEQPWNWVQLSSPVDRRLFKKLQGKERGISVVRTAGIVQEALGQKIDDELGTGSKESTQPRPCFAA